MHCSRTSRDSEDVRSSVRSGQAPASTTTQVWSLNATLVMAHAASNCILVSLPGEEGDEVVQDARVQHRLHRRIGLLRQEPADAPRPLHLRFRVLRADRRHGGRHHHITIALQLIGGMLQCISILLYRAIDTYRCLSVG